MGDRVNVKVMYENGTSIYLYSHNSGYCMAEIVRQAIAREQRWSDPAYLTRIIFCEMLRRECNDGKVNTAEEQQDTLASELGFGIHTEECDPENPTIVVDTTNLTVRLQDKVLKFVEFIRLTDKDVMRLHGTLNESEEES